MITPLLLPFSLTFQRGDPIPMMNRTQYASQRSRWTEVPLGVAPRFGVDEREYDLASEDVVTLPAENADPLVQRDAAERLD